MNKTPTDKKMELLGQAIGTAVLVAMVVYALKHPVKTFFIVILFIFIAIIVLFCTVIHQAEHNPTLPSTVTESALLPSASNAQ